MHVTFRELNEIIITSIQKTDLENLVKKEAITSEPKLMWANQILFCCYEFSSEKIQAKRLEGLLFLDEVVYADCSEYLQKAKYNGFEIEVLNVSNHSVFEPLTRFLRGKK